VSIQKYRVCDRCHCEVKSDVTERDGLPDGWRQLVIDKKDKRDLCGDCFDDFKVFLKRPEAGSES